MSEYKTGPNNLQVNYNFPFKINSTENKTCQTENLLTVGELENPLRHSENRMNNLVRKKRIPRQSNKTSADFPTENQIKKKLHDTKSNFSLQSSRLPASLDYGSRQLRTENAKKKKIQRCDGAHAHKRHGGDAHGHNNRRAGAMRALHAFPVAWTR